MFAKGDEVVAAIGGFTHVFVDRLERRPQPMPEPVRSALSTLA